MTLQQLLEIQEPEELEKLTDAELEAILSPYYTVTRPSGDIKRIIQEKEDESPASIAAIKKKIPLAALKILEGLGVK